MYSFVSHLFYWFIIYSSNTPSLLVTTRAQVFIVVLSSVGYFLIIICTLFLSKPFPGNGGSTKGLICLCVGCISCQVLEVIRWRQFVQALGRHQEAVACYNRSIQLQPDCAIAYGKYINRVTYLWWCTKSRLEVRHDCCHLSSCEVLMWCKWWNIFCVCINWLINAQRKPHLHNATFRTMTSLNSARSF